MAAGDLGLVGQSALGLVDQEEGQNQEHVMPLPLLMVGKDAED